MAEAGKGLEANPNGDKANPFSFKSFMKRSSSEAVVGDQKATVGEVKASKSSKQKIAKKKVGGEELLPFPELSEEGRKGAGDNPFSFKKFVKTKKKDSPLTHPLSGAIDNSSEGTTDESDSEIDDLFPAVSSTEPKPPRQSNTKTSRSYSLPIQPIAKPDTLRKETNRTTAKIQTVPSENFDLFDSDSDNSFGVNDEDSLLFQKSSSVDLGPPLTSFPHVHSKGNGVVGVARSHKGADPLVTSLGIDSDSFESGSSLSLEGGSKDVDVMPDMSGLLDIPGSGGDTVLVRKLRAENEKLKTELVKSQQETSKQKEKNSSLKEKLKSLKKKEAEDTKALEDMVLKVESNLVSTTKRAVSAESTILKLKQEIQSLQVQLSQATPQSVHQKYDEMLRGVKEKAVYASTQLVSASQKADQSIRELVSGVETLKNVADILQFIDSISEIKDQRTK